MSIKNPFEEFQKGISGETPERVKEQAQQIWLAGLGAFAKAQEEGAKAFERLVRDGLEMQRKTQEVAEEKISEMTQRMQGLATDVSERAGGQWGRLEGIFEERVAKALARLNVPTASELSALRAELETLQATLAQAGLKPKPSARAATKTAAKSAPKASAGKKS